MLQLPDPAHSPFDDAAPAWIADGARGDTGGEASKALFEAKLTAAQGTGPHQPDVCPVPIIVVLQGASMLLLPVLGNVADW